LSVPVQVIDWKDLSPEWPTVLMGRLNPTHLLTALDWLSKTWKE